MTDEAEQGEGKTTARRGAKLTEAEAVSAAQARAQGIVDEWVAQKLRNSPFSRDTDAWNTVHRALPDLVTAIAQEINA